MDVANKGYPFHYKTKKKPHSNKECLISTLVYVFKNRKNFVYIVLVEHYKNDVYAIKFFQKNHSDSKQRYLIKTNQFDARRIIKTCVDIGKHVLDGNPLASFVFIGSPTIEEASREQNKLDNTKRYRVYKNYASFYFSSESFIHCKIQSN